MDHELLLCILYLLVITYKLNEVIDEDGVVLLIE